MNFQKNKFEIAGRSLLLIISVLVAALFFSCGKEEEKESNQLNKEGAAYSPDKDASIQKYNLEHQKKMTSGRFACDTLSLKEFVLSNYPEGTYLIDFDKTLTYNVPRPAVIYPNKYPGYIFGIIAKSKSGERFIEPKNIIGYNESFIDLDSTKLGTAFFYLVLFHCEQNTFNVVWESVIPSHGGFNTFSIENWKYLNIPYIRVNFHYAQGIGHIDYNYFLVEGLTAKPHLLMTYKGINFQRTITNYNNDRYPDYYEYVYYDSGKRVEALDSIPFVWNRLKNSYINTRNSKQTRPY
jgi:hypothetical protein